MAEGGRIFRRFKEGIAQGYSKQEVSSAIHEDRDFKSNANDSRKALFGTEGGASGEEVGIGGVSKRRNLFGN